MKPLVLIFIAVAVFFNVDSYFHQGYAQTYTPIMTKYKKYYEADDFYAVAILIEFRKECKEKCTDADRDAIKKLANSGDKYGWALMSTVGDNKSWRQDIEAGVKAGDPFSSLFYIVMNSEQNTDDAINVAISGKEKGYLFGYWQLPFLYLNKNDTENFCSAIDDFYKAKGAIAISSYIVSPNNRYAKTFFSKCTKKTPEELIVTLGIEGQLIKGYSFAKRKRYYQAYKIFGSIYKEGDSSMISANAGYCLGMMNYYGKGTKRDKDKGLKLLKESFDNGIVYSDTPGQVEYALPERTNLQMYPFISIGCVDIK